jgi:hypothetical protein
MAGSGEVGQPTSLGGGPVLEGVVRTACAQRGTLDVHKDCRGQYGKRLSSFDAAADHPPRKNWTEPIREPKRPTHGYIGLQNHDPGDVVWFKEVSVRPLDRAK